jgi:hypothetical protein
MGRALAGVRIGDLRSTKALHLYGTGTSNIDFGVHTFLNGKSFTLGCRIWPTRNSNTDDGGLWSYGFDSGGNGGYFLRPNATTRQLQIFFGGGSQTTANYRMVGKHYLFVEYDGQHFRVYRNTTLVDTIADTTSFRNAFPGRSTMFGCRDADARYYAGVVGDGAIYSRILTSQEKQRIVSEAFYPTTGAEIIMRCDENTGTVITDYSGNNRHGTLNTGLWRTSPFNA